MFTKIEKHQRNNNKPSRNKDGQRWRRLTRISNNELDKFRLSFSRSTNPSKMLCFESSPSIFVVTEALLSSSLKRHIFFKTSTFVYFSKVIQLLFKFTSKNRQLINILISIKYLPILHARVMLLLQYMIDRYLVTYLEKS